MTLVCGVCKQEVSVPPMLKAIYIKCPKCGTLLRIYD
jgi:DNA-directed RNA polymerase subunit RPC12/RpoP